MNNLADITLDICDYTDGCDTDYTSNRRRVEIDDLAARIEGMVPPSHLVVLTGGEPLRQPNATRTLGRTMIAKGYEVQIETNGAFPLPPGLVGAFSVVVSPKTPTVRIRRPHAYKYVLHADEVDGDGLPFRALLLGERRLARPPKGVSGASDLPAAVRRGLARRERASTSPRP